MKISLNVNACNLDTPLQNKRDMRVKIADDHRERI